MTIYENDEIVIEDNKPKAIKLVQRSFWLGFIFHSLLTLFIQDWMGLEYYSKYAAEHWMDIHWAVWLPGIFIVAYWYQKTINQANTN